MKKITDDGWNVIFVAIIVSIVTLNMISPHWIHLWVSIVVIISVYLILSPLLGKQKDRELDELYSEYHTLCEEIKFLKRKKRMQR